MRNRRRVGADDAGNLNRTVAAVFGAVFLLVGLVGFTRTGDVDFAGRAGASLLGFSVNGLHNVVHLAVGALLLAAAVRGFAPARNANLLVGVIYLVVGVLGLFLADTGADILALNTADNLLHLVSGGLLTAVALTYQPARSRI